MTRLQKLLDFFGCKPDKIRGFDGLSNTSVCVRCKRNILQDSLGGWFPATYQDAITNEENKEGL